MLQGKVQAALKLLTTDYDNGVLKVDNLVLNELKQKHPPPAPIQNNTLLNGPVNKVLDCFFDPIDEQMIEKAARMTRGSGGPSQLDAEQYRHILVSKKYKKESKELREQMATLAKHLAINIVDPSSLEALTACRLIPLNKNPGIRPIGVGEVLRRIIGKTLSWLLKDDIQEATSPLQTATGLKGGAEAAIHAMRDIFENDNTDGVMLIDVSNALNCLNCHVALHNVQVLCPSMSCIMINTYRKPSRLIILGSNEILSREGTTQGDNLAMPFYAIGTIPLINRLKILGSNVKQVWLADDATGAELLNDLKSWWDSLVEFGKSIGYYDQSLG